MSTISTKLMKCYIRKWSHKLCALSLCSVTALLNTDHAKLWDIFH